MVWHAPPVPPPDAVADAALPPHALGSLMVCAAHQPSAVFQSEYLPFMDQFAQSLQLWSPDSNAFCYAAVDAGARKWPALNAASCSAIETAAAPRVAHSNREAHVHDLLVQSACRARLAGDWAREQLHLRAAGAQPRGAAGGSRRGARPRPR